MQTSVSRDEQESAVHVSPRTVMSISPLSWAVKGLKALRLKTDHFPETPRTIKFSTPKIAHAKLPTYIPAMPDRIKWRKEVDRAVEWCDSPGTGREEPRTGYLPVACGRREHGARLTRARETRHISWSTGEASYLSREAWVQWVDTRVDEPNDDPFPGCLPSSLLLPQTLGKP